MSLPRRVEPEMLDALPANDPRAVHSRRDLQRINRVMGTCGLISKAIDGIVASGPSGRADAYAGRPLALVELGAGDGSLMLRIARRNARRWPRASVGLLDMQPVVRADTLTAFAEVGWKARIVGADVFDWFRHDGDGIEAPIVVANLFVHHFDGERLRQLLTAVASRARAFVACEPRRDRIALAGSAMLWVLGCNRVTVHDGLLSVRAGFRDDELSTLWPERERGQLREERIGPFVHRFVAVRKDA